MPPVNWSDPPGPTLTEIVDGRKDILAPDDVPNRLPIEHGTRKGYMQENRRGVVPCRECRKAHALYQREHYQLNKDYYRERDRKKAARKRKEREDAAADAESTPAEDQRPGPEAEAAEERPGAGADPI